MNNDSPSAELPDFYETVAADMLDYVGVGDGVWLDVGSGAGGVGLAVAARCAGTMVLLDPNAESLRVDESRKTEMRAGRRNGRKTHLTIGCLPDSILVHA